MTLELHTDSDDHRHFLVRGAGPGTALDCESRVRGFEPRHAPFT